MSEKNYPPLPEPLYEQGDFPSFGEVAAACFTSYQMRAYVDADRAQRLPLTDGQIERIYEKFGGDMINCARSIERQHGIGGHVVNKGETK